MKTGEQDIQEFVQELKEEGFEFQAVDDHRDPLIEVKGRRFIYFLFDKEGHFLVDVSQKEIHHYPQGTEDPEKTAYLIKKMRKMAKKIILANLF